MINLKDLDQKIGGAKNFTWKDALWLSKWEIACVPTADQTINILDVALKLQSIREYFNSPILVTSWLRPLKYNLQIKGALNSAHTEGKAVDFNVIGYDPNEIRKELIPQLDNLKIRMEDLDDSNWVHIDIREPGKGGRFFKP